jgi:hypothetical protein
MQSTGHGSTHLSHPEHNSGMMMTSIPWLKMAPKFGGQARRQASQLMHSLMSIYSAGFGHLEFRSRFSMRCNRAVLFPPLATAKILRPSTHRSSNHCGDQSCKHCRYRESMTHAFLSDEWIEAALAMQDEFTDRVPAPSQIIAMNLIVNETPFGSDPIELHVDNSDGLPRIDRGHVDEADVTITTDHRTARDLFVANDQQLAMQAFMTGKIRVDGDVAKLLAVQASSMSTDETVATVRDEVASRLQALTA